MTNSYMNGQAGTETGLAAGAAPTKRKPGRPRKVVAAPEPRPVSAVIAREFWDMSKGKIVGWFSAAIMALVAGGWIMLPAKQSDLDALKVEVRSGFAAIDQRLGKIDGQFGAIRDSYGLIIAEIGRLRDAQEVRRAVSSPSAPIAPSRPRRAPAPSPVPEKTPNIFGF